MRKVVLAAIAALLVCGTLSADVLDFTPHAGYTSFAMNSFNRANGNVFGWEGAGESMGYNQDIQSGIVVGADETTKCLSPWKSLDLGLREEYLVSNQARLVSDQGSDNDGLDYSDKASLTNILVGGKVSAPFSVPGLSLGLGAWVGYGYATMDQHVNYDGFDGDNLMQSGLYTAGILVGELESTVTYKIGSHIGLNFTGGWRWADAPELKSHGTPLYDAEQYWEWNISSPVNVDFSGATAQGSVDLYF
ncbi:MAG TPA: hypothetical protein VK914_10780 [bacterium]|nr:hypothetical protein [bacterium]